MIKNKKTVKTTKILKTTDQYNWGLNEQNCIESTHLSLLLKLSENLSIQVEVNACILVMIMKQSLEINLISHDLRIGLIETT